MITYLLSWMISRFPEVEIAGSTSAKTVIPKLDSIFARQGIPAVVKSDNGSPFNSDDFLNFARHLGFTHRRVTPLWPQANGEVEHFMGPLMKMIRAAYVESRTSPVSQTVSKVATPHVAIGVPPAEALYGRKLRTTLPSLSQLLLDHQAVHEKVKVTDMLYKDKAKSYSDACRNAQSSSLKQGDKCCTCQTTTFQQVGYSF